MVGTGFQFRLQSVLNWRIQLEKDQKERFSRAAGILHELLAEKEELGREHLHWSEQYVGSVSGGTSPAQADRIAQYLAGLQERLKVNEGKIREQEAVADKERALLVEKMQDRKLLETLRDRQRERFLAEERRKDEKEAQETAAYRHITRKDDG